MKAFGFTGYNAHPRDPSLRAHMRSRFVQDDKRSEPIAKIEINPTLLRALPDSRAFPPTTALRFLRRYKLRELASGE